MIQLNELRVGNIIRLKEDAPNNYFRVMEVGETMKCFDYDEDQPGYWDLRDFEPIVLTPEILKECGCELSPDNEHYFIGHNGFCLVWDGEDFCLKMDATEPYVTAYCRYLHQFQNLYFCLKQQELNFPI